jgi:hypothetical protein
MHVAWRATYFVTYSIVVMQREVTQMLLEGQSHKSAVSKGSSAGYGTYVGPLDEFESLQKCQIGGESWSLGWTRRLARKGRGTVGEATGGSTCI